VKNKNFQKLNISPKLLLGAGPSNPNPEVLEAMTLPVVGHLDPTFLQVMDDVHEMLKIAFQTSNPMTLPLSGTGTAGMEACILNLVEPEDTVLGIENGYFGHRMIEVAKRSRANIIPLSFEWGKSMDLELIEKTLQDNPSINIVLCVHAETSTGVLNPIKEITELAHKYDSLIVADTVTSLGGVDLQIDNWDIDISYSVTQKCLGCPPGLSPVTVNQASIDKMEHRSVPPNTWYYDLLLLQKTYWGAAQKTYHHTAPITMIYGLREGLRLLVEEGIEERIQKHTDNCNALRKGLEIMGLEMLVPEGQNISSLTTVKIPEQINDGQLRSQLLKNHSIEISAGLGNLGGKVWRIGLMGENSKKENVFRFLEALEIELKAQGMNVSAKEAISQLT
jgi:alanine-glyoxylate transaminase/serine-glyoxylate transaminase/serine-pyruvate transaminase